MYSDTLLYVLGYAYGYNGILPHTELVEKDVFSQGMRDAYGDRAEGAQPMCDFNAAHHIQREIGTEMTAIANPLVKIGHVHGTVYVLGAHKEIEGFRILYVSAPRNYAGGCDRTWEVVSNA
jgi:hypothetical protein